MASKTAQQILDVAQEMVRNRGYSAFSYADISERVGIRKASIHYHFPSKDDLVRELVQQYRQGMAGQCDLIAQSTMTPQQQLVAFANLYRDGLLLDQICLCAMLAADFVVLPQPIQREVQLFFCQAETWLVQLLKQGCEDGLWQCHPSVDLEAKGLIAMLQGAQLLARSSEDSAAAFDQVIYPLLTAKFATE